MNNMKKTGYSIIKGFIISLVISLISIFIYATILVKTNVEETTIKPVITIITGISILMGSSIGCLKINKNGILNGVCVGGLYILSLYILSSIAFCGFGLNLNSVIIIIVGMILGGIGGIIGVNIGR